MSYVLRELSRPEEYVALAALERRIWGADTLALPPELLRAARDEGALVAGVYAEGEVLAAFIFAFPTSFPGVQHSHALGVDAAHRGAGLGARLKFWQRDWCLARGVHTVRWTFDPLRLPNAQLNIARLGAHARQYFEDYYGTLPGINAGTPSDRLLAEWDLEDPRVRDLAHGRAVTAGAAVKGSERVEIPTDFAALLEHDPDAALAWRLSTRRALQDLFARGYRIVGFAPEPQPAYLLERGRD